MGKIQDSLGLHDISSKGGMRKLLLAVQERVAVEVDVGVVNALLAEGVSDPFAGHGCCHQRHNVAHPARQLEHDDHQGDY
jgi:hypothetical protein